MSQSFDRFVAGSDGLAALLRALPAHTPPASMQAWFAQAARNADAERAAVNPPQDTLQFEAPATMAAMFAAAAAQAEQAQAARRAAVQARLAQSQPVDQAGTTNLSESARAWIAAQQLHADTAELPPTADVAAASAASLATAAPASAEEAGAASGVASRALPAPDFASTSASTSHAAQAQASANTASSNPAPAGNAAARRRSSRRPRWMPTLAFAASITLVVGIGLQWQAGQPTAEAPPAAAVGTAVVEPSTVHPARRAPEQVDPGADHMLVLPAVPAPADAEVPETAARPSAASPSPPPAPSDLPSPALAPEPASAAAPVAPAPSFDSALAAEPTPGTELQSADAQPPAAPAPAPAPIAALPEDASVSGSLAASARRSTSAALAPIPPSHAPASLPAPMPVTEQAQIVISATDDTLQSRAPGAGQPAPLRVLHAPLPQTDATRATPPTSQPAVGTTATEIGMSRAKSAPARRIAPITRAMSPVDWLARHAVADDHAPARIRILAATPDAPEVQDWATRLRARLRQRGWSTQVEVLKDAGLEADQLRVEPLTATP
ncbi:virulence protein [Xanthomonas arboricola pv. fragariae]|nr:virulence protein [Xanthomonas arboricola pv. fragariae]